MTITFSVALQVGGGRLYRVPPIRKFFHTVTGARYAMLFHNGGLKDNGITFFPNHDSFHCSQLLPICRCCRRAEEESDLPEAIVVSAKDLIISQKKDLDEDQVQWGSEYRTNLVFKWSKVVRSPNGP